ncbi:thiamine pyrophosphate-binding protein [Paenibacillus sp. FSL E2-8871]|uniref:thiamine pyrophosphate-binding protein n=1 Tax=unclassified Paenibacillus TaxID=185978 RepID=UPI000693C1DA|nr:MULTISPECIES: thiamine pyrophosphate-binding protein [unclassified Paenibacillus]KAA1181636.1 thiamine pyrophosphate-binding protein [Paenibacillus sp. B2(2019)]
MYFLKTVADYMSEALRNLGVTHSFGIIGKSICPIVLKMVDYGIEFIPGRHESSSGFEAAGYALKTGKLGVAFGTSGPGGTNLLTAAAHAKANNLPVLFITGHQSIKELGIPQCQDSTSFLADLADMFRPATLYSKLIERGDHFNTIFNHAISIALSGNRGPVHLCIPFDVQTELLEECNIVIPERESLVSHANIDRVLDAINNSKNPIIIAGKGVNRSGAHSELIQLAETFNIPVVTSPGGKGAIAWDHPLYHGPIGVGGCTHGDDLLNQSDLFIVLGSRLSDMTICNLKRENHPATLIQFDSDPTFVGKILFSKTIPVTGDLRDNLVYYLNNIDTNNITKREAPTNSDYTEEPPILPNLSLASVLSTMSDLIPYNSTVFVDDGSHGFHAAKWYKVKKPGSFVFDAYFACMGNSIGMAIGAKVAAPEETIFCITGDGCFMMLGAEINAAVCKDIPVIFIVVNNKQLDMALKGMEKTTGRIDGTIYEVPMDAVKFAESLGAKGYKCETAEEFETAIKDAVAINRVAVIELLTDRDEVPPTAHRTLNLN